MQRHFPLLCAFSLLALGACLLAADLAAPSPFYLGKRFERLDRFRAEAARQREPAAVTALAMTVMNEDIVLFKSENIDLTLARLASLVAAACSAANLFVLVRWRADVTSTLKPPV